MASVSDIEESSDAKSFETGANYIDLFEAITHWSLCVRFAICLFVKLFPLSQLLFPFV